VLSLGVEPREKPPPARDPDDRALMALVARGDAAAFRQIVDRHIAMVHSLAWRMLGDAAEAEDVVQDAFAKVWTNAPGWAPAGGGLGGWLRRIATNLCFDRLRRRRLLSGEPVPERANEAPAADEMIDEARKRDAIAAAIQALPDRQRAAIVLTYHEGLSNAEAAETLGIGVKALESLLVRARQALIRALTASGLIAGEDGR
jgi:RNA polymerase sigma factor (sigma-70 family)